MRGRCLIATCRAHQTASTSVVGLAADGRLGSWNSVRIPQVFALQVFAL